MSIPPINPLIRDFQDFESIFSSIKFSLLNNVEDFILAENEKDKSLFYQDTISDFRNQRNTDIISEITIATEDEIPINPLNKQVTRHPFNGYD